MDNPFIGMLAWFGFTFAPRDWGFCNGAILAIAQEQTLYSLYGTQYGGDGRSSFGVPDLRGRSAVGSSLMGNPPGLTPIIQGQRVGAQVHTLSIPEMPQHNHAATFTPGGASGGTVKLDVTFSASSADATEHAAGTNGANSLAAPKQGFSDILGYNTSTPDVMLDGVTATGGVSGITVDGTITVGDTGATQAFEIQSPVQGLNACYATNGLYPSRN